MKDLLQEKASGNVLMTNVVESGERMYANMTPDGREIVRGEIQRLRQSWDHVFEEVLTSQRQLEVALIEWTSFTDSFTQIQEWLSNSELQLGDGDAPLVATLEEKKTQLQSYKASF